MPVIMKLTVDQWERIEFTDYVKVTPIWCDGVELSFKVEEKVYD